MMNDITADSLGEVLAIAEASVDTLERYHEAMLGELDQEGYRKLTERMQSLVQEVRDLADENQQLAPVTTSAAFTGVKVAAMQDDYMADDIESTTRLYKWLGFLCGGAVAHWAVIRGAGLSLRNPRITDLAERALSYYVGWLEYIDLYEQTIGKQRARA